MKRYFTVKCPEGEFDIWIDYEGDIDVAQIAIPWEVFAICFGDEDEEPDCTIDRIEPMAEPAEEGIQWVFEIDYPAKPW